MIKKLFLVASVATLTLAQTTTDIALTGAYEKFDDEYYLSYPGHFYGLRGGMYIDNSYGFQIGYEHANRANCKGLKLNKTYLNALLMHEVSHGTTPYLLGTFGYETSSIEDHKPSQSIAGVGAGVRLDLKNNFGAFAETRLLKRLKTDDTDIETTLGLSYKFSSIADTFTPTLIEQKENKKTIQRKNVQRPHILIKEVIVDKQPKDIFAGRVLHQNSYEAKPISENRYFIQLALLSASSPSTLIKKAKRAGFYNVSTKNKAGATAVVVGPYPNRQRATKELHKLKSIVKDAFITKF